MATNRTLRLFELMGRFRTPADVTDAPEKDIRNATRNATLRKPALVIDTHTLRGFVRIGFIRFQDKAEQAYPKIVPYLQRHGRLMISILVTG